MSEEGDDDAGERRIYQGKKIGPRPAIFAPDQLDYASR
jgi:hypothetical protein